MGADVCALAAGACALPLLRNASRVPAPLERTRALWHGLLVIAAFAPPAWAVARPSERPAYVQALSVPGKINVIEFSDFECPFCRAMHPVLKAALGPYGTRVHFVRKTFPLIGHAHSRDAARAYLCAGALGRAEAIADWLFAADDVSAESCAKQAAVLGLDTGAVRGLCRRRRRPSRRVARDAAAIEAADFQGLPTVWIGAQRIIGFDRDASPAAYAAALDRAARHADTRPRPAPLLAVFVLASLVSARCCGGADRCAVRVRRLRRRCASRSRRRPACGRAC